MANFLDDQNRLNLQEMVSAYEADDNTSKIRTLQHSSKIKNDVEQLLNLKKKYARLQKQDYKKFEKLVVSHCNFLWNNYTNIFNRLMKNELNLNILKAFIRKLKEIEDGVTDQHEASVHIGQILKEMYVDSALKREKNYEETESKNKKKEKKPSHNISWNQFKKIQP